MNWPEDFEGIECVGFNPALWPIIAEAWDNGHVDKHVGGIRHTSTAISWTFDYLGFRYQIDCEEHTEQRPDGGFQWVSTPFRLTKIAKVGIDDDGGPILIEEYPLVVTLNPQQKARYQQVWGSF